MKWTTVCGVLSLLFTIDCAGVKGHNCPQAPDSYTLPPGQRIASEILNINEPREVKESSTFGGEEGDPWGDPVEPYKLSQIQSITIWHGAWVEGIQVVYYNGTLYNAPLHGSDKGKYNDTIPLDSDHLIVRVEGYTDGKHVGNLMFTVQSKIGGPPTYYGPYGRNITGDKYALDAIILGFHGRAGETLIALGVYYLSLEEKSPQFGGVAGDLWEDPVNTNSPPIVGIKRITITYSTVIDSIQVDYRLLWDGTLNGDKHGGEGSSMYMMDLEEGERLIEVRASAGALLSQVAFITEKSDGTIGEYGPFGQERKDDNIISFFGDIIGFWGTEGSVVYSLGVYYTDC